MVVAPFLARAFGYNITDDSNWDLLFSSDSLQLNISTRHARSKMGVNNNEDGNDATIGYTGWGLEHSWSFTLLLFENRFQDDPHQQWQCVIILFSKWVKVRRV